MKSEISFGWNPSRKVLLFLVVVIGLTMTGTAYAQRAIISTNDNDAQFGPVMRAYLGYLRNEQEVVDDRVSRREITMAYYHRNSNRIRALRQIATRLVRNNGNDYVPELEAVAPDELRTLFESPPGTGSLKTNQVLDNKFRFLGIVHANEPFYVFARLDPYEQAELMQKEQVNPVRSSVTENPNGATPTGQRVGQSTSRPKRVIPH